MPHDLTPDPDGNQTPIAPDGSDPLTAASAEAFLQRLADKDAKLGQLTRAWLTLDNVTRDTGQIFDIDLVSSYPSGAWTMIDTNKGIEVPEPGMYEISISAGIVRDTGEGNFALMYVAIGTSSVGSFTTVGYAQGFRYDAAEAMPVVATGGLPSFPISDPATTRLFFFAGNDNLTPLNETLAPGEVHKIVITRIGDLP